MNVPEWLKPGLYGAGVGAAALAIVGFSWGGWVTGSTAREMASDQSRLEVVAALVPICVQQSRKDPKFKATLAEIEAVKSYQRREMLMEAGWATMPGATEPDRAVAIACLKEIVAS